MKSIIEAVMFVITFLSLIFFFLASRWKYRLLCGLPLLLCFLYYVYHIHTF